MYCRTAAYGQCIGGGGWVLGHRIDGVQAEFALIPFADTSLYLLPDSVSDQAALMLADIIPTAYEVGARNGKVQPGDTVVIVGAGPVGLAAITTAKLFSPSTIVVIDREPTRLATAKAFGADILVTPGEDPAAAVAAVTSGLGAEVAIEAVGLSETFELCTRLVRPGSHMANIGVHSKPASLHLEDLWIRDITITTGLVDTSSTPMLLRMLAAGKLDTAPFITHEFKLDEMEKAYDGCSPASRTPTRSRWHCSGRSTGLPRIGTDFAPASASLRALPLEPTRVRTLHRVFLSAAPSR